jgi:hypothetical protein
MISSPDNLPDFVETPTDAPIILSAEESIAIATSKAAAARNDFATDEEVQAVWAKYGL